MLYVRQGRRRVAATCANIATLFFLAKRGPRLPPSRATSTHTAAATLQKTRTFCENQYEINKNRSIFAIQARQNARQIDIICQQHKLRIKRVFPKLASPSNLLWKIFSIRRRRRCRQKEKKKFARRTSLANASVCVSPPLCVCMFASACISRPTLSIITKSIVIISPYSYSTTR